jgi:hypothetical protein
VGIYFRLSGGWTEPEIVDRSPPVGDPLTVILARRLELDATLPRA